MVCFGCTILSFCSYTFRLKRIYFYYGFGKTVCEGIYNFWNTTKRVIMVTVSVWET